MGVACFDDQDSAELSRVETDSDALPAQAAQRVEGEQAVPDFGADAAADATTA